MSNKRNLRDLAIYGSLSLNLGLMVAGGYFLGNLLEKNFHWPNMIVIGVLGGLFLGFYEMFAIAYRGRKK